MIHHDHHESFLVWFTVGPNSGTKVALDVLLSLPADESPTLRVFLRFELSSIQKMKQSSKSLLVWIRIACREFMIQHIDTTIYMEYVFDFSF